MGLRSIGIAELLVIMGLCGCVGALLIGVVVAIVVGTRKRSGD